APPRPRQPPPIARDARRGVPVNDLFDPEVRELLDERTEHIVPRPGALDRVRVGARRRHRRRRVAVGTSALVATSVALAFAGGAPREPLDAGGHAPGAS